MSQLAARSAAEAVLSPPSARSEAAHDWLGTLEEVPLFEGLPKRHLRRVAKLARIRRFAPGSALVRAGARSPPASARPRRASKPLRASDGARQRGPRAMDLWGWVGYSGEQWWNREERPHAPWRIRAHDRRQEPAHASGEVPPGVRG